MSIRAIFNLISKVIRDYIGKNDLHFAMWLVFTPLPFSQPEEKIEWFPALSTR